VTEQDFKGLEMPDVEKRTDSQTTRPKVIVGLTVATMVVVTGLVFVLARRLGWTLGWIYVGIVVATLTINLACLLRWNPELIRRRMRLGKFTKTWDKVWAVLFGLAMIAIYVAAVLETRDRVSSAPGAAWLLGLAIFVPGWGLAIWSMVVNPFFEKTVRIQTDHGHRVIDTGPYAYMRHPGYVGFSGWMLSTPLQSLCVFGNIKYSYGRSLCVKNFPKSAKIGKNRKKHGKPYLTNSVAYNKLRRLGNSEVLSSNPSDGS
jgi:protein-S-isoprenylcysteine O-methyltransferase Ste14